MMDGLSPCHCDFISDYLHIQKQPIRKARNSTATRTTLHRAIELCLCMRIDR